MNFAIHCHSSLISLPPHIQVFLGPPRRPDLKKVSQEGHMVQQHHMAGDFLGCEFGDAVPRSGLAILQLKTGMKTHQERYGDCLIKVCGGPFSVCVLTVHWSLSRILSFFAFRIVRFEFSSPLQWKQQTVVNNSVSQGWISKAVFQWISKAVFLTHPQGL